MEEVQSIANRRRADDSPRVDALDLLRHNGVVPVRSQTLACGGDVLRATCVRAFARCPRETSGCRVLCCFLLLLLGYTNAHGQVSVQ